MKIVPNRHHHHHHHHHRTQPYISLSYSSLYGYLAGFIRLITSLTASAVASSVSSLSHRRLQASFGSSQTYHDFHRKSAHTNGEKALEKGAENDPQTFQQK